MPSDIEIAQKNPPKPITDIAKKSLGIDDAQHLSLYGGDKAKFTRACLDSLADKPAGKLILVTAITPTPAGEGKTTTTVGLTDGLNHIGKKAAAALREPSLGPVFGMKGGAAGGGYSQVIPMEDLNLHFTGDFAAISLAHNLLAAMIDNHIHHGNELDIDPRRISWRRVVDMNDRALRRITVGLGGPGNGFPREDGFDIVVASEIMAILCLSESLGELKQRLAAITIGYSRAKKRLTVADLGAQGAMSVLLKDAIRPNLAQTLEANPVIIHGGPFANIAHGCNSVIATKLALKLADYVVTEAGFGADLGAEKFLDIKCRKSGLSPDASVLVATIRALKYHGGCDMARIYEPNTDALRAGFANLARHVENIVTHYRLPVVVAVNRFAKDSEDEMALLQELLQAHGIDYVFCNNWAEGGAGAADLAKRVVAITETPQATQDHFLYGDDESISAKIEKVATNLYGAGQVVIPQSLQPKLRELEQEFSHYPVCIAKTQYSFSDEPTNRGIPTDGHSLHVRDLLLCSGAEFIVVYVGQIMTMPGLPKRPAAADIDIDADGAVTNLF